ncbi:hypothetical protein ACFZBU_15155 [Embleya sp. NPDC008237]|uniref:hypothetical protein n=1 Tax=Embleya sp. NPDC008237 TaxID=3363978 RepID=UPI0036EF9CE5
MKRAIGTIGDRLLGRVLTEKRAGACVEYVGRLCHCRDGREYRYSRNGVCTLRPGNPC